MLGNAEMCTAEGIARSLGRSLMVLGCSAMAVGDGVVARETGKVKSSVVKIVKPQVYLPLSRGRSKRRDGIGFGTGGLDETGGKCEVR